LKIENYIEPFSEALWIHASSDASGMGGMFSPCGFIERPLRLPEADGVLLRLLAEAALAIPLAEAVLVMPIAVDALFSYL